MANLDVTKRGTLVRKKLNKYLQWLKAYIHTIQARWKQLSVGAAGRDERAKRPLWCLRHAPRKYFGISDLRSFLVQSGGEIA